LSATCFHVEFEQFWHAFASREFVSDSWAFLYVSPEIASNYCSMNHESVGEMGDF